MKYKKGDRVRMLPDHPYSYQATGRNGEMLEGVITDARVGKWPGAHGDGKNVYQIVWSNGRENSYTDCHIESAMPMTNKAAKALLVKR